LRTFCLALILTLLVQLPAQSQEASALGLKGPVYTVLTEEFNNENSTSQESSGSAFDVYDRKGYLLELYRYKPDGSLLAHTIFSRKGEQIFKSQTTGTVPFENFSVQNTYDADGHILETDTYNADGVLTEKTKNEFLENRPELTTYRSIESGVEGTENAREIVESTDPKTGLTHQIATMNGKPETDWVIQRDGNGIPEKDKIIYADGSYNERERGADGTTVEYRYSTSSKSHTYQKTDAQGHLIEVVDKSGSSYIRCTYSFDEDGRPTGQVNYDGSGKILDKSTIEYRDDSFGNWIEKKIILWDTTSEPMKRKLIVTSLRTINSY
jgi:YD repeat-containing protein